ncbi:MAG: hypothetical protein NT157_01330 [Candidatus Micrarchaeota archaeon]|nr:hypothetical protein [Candidatus Micrarchaeota archaeon]
MKGGEMKTVERIAEGQAFVRDYHRGKPDFHHAKGVIERFPEIKLDIARFQPTGLSEVSIGSKILQWPKSTVQDAKPFVKAHGVIETEAPRKVVEVFAHAKPPTEAITAAPAKAVTPKATFVTTYPKLVTPIANAAATIVKAVTAAIPLIFSLLALRIMWDAVKPRPPRFA